MAWWQIVLLTILCYQLIMFIVGSCNLRYNRFIDMETFSYGIIHCLLMIIFYPYRKWNRYKGSIEYCKINNFTFWDVFFNSKRYRHRNDEDEYENQWDEW